MSGSLNYTEFFIDKEASTIKLNDALRERDKRIGFIEPPGFKENIEKLKITIKELKEKQIIFSSIIFKNQ